MNKYSSIVPFKTGGARLVSLCYLQRSGFCLSLFLVYVGYAALDNLHHVVVVKTVFYFLAELACLYKLCRA